MPRHYIDPTTGKVVAIIDDDTARKVDAVKAARVDYVEPPGLLSPGDIQAIDLIYKEGRPDDISVY